MNNPKKHHYVPRFYLRAWEEADGLVPTFICLPDKPIKATRLATDNINVEQFLYSLDHVPPNLRHVIESDFFTKVIDTPASQVFDRLRAGEVEQLTHQECVYWARFLTASRARTPDMVSVLKELTAAELEKSLRTVGEHEKAELEKHGYKDMYEFALDRKREVIANFPIRRLPRIILNKNVIEDILKMTWAVYGVPESGLPFLTCDRPFYMLGGTAEPDGLIAMSLSPTQLFMAAHDRSKLDQIAAKPRRELVRRFNTSIVAQSARMICGNAEQSFIRKYWKAESSFEKAPFWRPKPMT